eukprot:887683-Prymnesium_polylepis.1
MAPGLVHGACRSRVCMCAAGGSQQPADDEPDELPENLIIPDRLPTFGLSERESTRLSYMFGREEPLFQEIVGLQVLMGMLGSNAMGFVGGVLGCFQFAPCFAFAPGRVGNGCRLIGWHIFSAMLK